MRLEVPAVLEQQVAAALEGLALRRGGGLADFLAADFVHHLPKGPDQVKQVKDDLGLRVVVLCPSRDGRPTHQHVLWTNDLLETHMVWLPRPLNRSRIQQWASRHHRPAEPEEWIIAEADRLASGHDRRPAEEDYPDFRQVPLHSIFGGLGLGRSETAPRGLFAPLVLRIDETLLPQRDVASGAMASAYASLAQALLSHLEACEPVPIGQVCAALHGWSERFFGNVVGSSMDLPDVSLHDHARLVAALAATLHVYHRDTGTYTESAIRDRKPAKFILLGGDLSGIQSYLFDMPTEAVKGIARAYRARSFYLAMLTHAASLKLLTQLGLPAFNRVLDAGGRFGLLMPDTPQARRGAEEVARDIDAWMLHRHGGRLTLNLDGSVHITGEDFLAERFLDVYRQFAQAGEAAKRRKLAGWLIRDGHWVTDRAQLEYIHTRQRQSEDLERDRHLGKHLPRTRYVGLWPGDGAPAGLLPEPVDVLGYRLQLFGEAPEGRALDEAADFFAVGGEAATPRWVPLRPVATYLPKLSRDDVARLRPRLPAHESDSTGDEEESLHPGRLATFAHLALLARTTDPGDPAQDRGLPAIACLKADVDRLGLLFREGFGAALSFGRVTTLSRQLDLFFKGFLGSQLSDAEGPYRHVYTVFAGGDDLMLIGPWTTMLRLATQLRAWFDRLTAGNPQVTLSAGLALGHERMPVSGLAQEAERQLEAAKDAGRNRISIFNEIYTWTEYERALEIGRRLDDLVGSGNGRDTLKLNTGFVYRLLQYDRMAARVDRARRAAPPDPMGGQPAARTVRMEDLRAELTWRSHLMYDLARNIRRHITDKSPRGVHEDFAWLESLVTKEMQAQEARLLKLAATYALYRNRGG